MYETLEIYGDLVVKPSKPFTREMVEAINEILEDMWNVQTPRLEPEFKEDKDANRQSR
jgi:hypothetical protein